MRFLSRKDNIKKTIIVISDIHLGAGKLWNSQRNYLEDFHHDKEFVDFINYFSTGNYNNKEVELIINGDFLDLLAVPFVQFHDDEFWSEEAALEKCKIIVDAHKEVFESLVNFLKTKNKKIVYQVGNHDAELILPKCRDYIISLFPEAVRDKFKLVYLEEYSPAVGVLVKHGHEFEYAHQFDPNESIFESEEGRKYFKPPWGSYYVTRIINKFKGERHYINQIRPIKYFLIHGLLFDSLLTIRFMLANLFYFIMVRFLTVYRKRGKLKVIWEQMKAELSLFVDIEELTHNYFLENPKVKTLIVGHTHEPTLRDFGDGRLFINTGTWTKMHYLDFSANSGFQLTFAQIDIDNQGEVEVDLNEWHGVQNSPYSEVAI